MFTSHETGRWAEGRDFHIGRASAFPQDADSREVLINKLEHSLEHAKNNQRGNLVFFSEEIARKHERGLVLREDLKQCIRNDFEGFELFFQPFISPASGTIAGCECLLRWKGERIKNSIIEGVEDSKVADIVGGLNATLLQGYHYSHPVCRKDFEKLLDEDRKQNKGN